MSGRPTNATIMCKNYVTAGRMNLKSFEYMARKFKDFKPKLKEF